MNQYPVTNDQKVTITTNKLSEVTNDYVSEEEDEEEEEGGYGLPYRLEKINLKERSDSVENNHFVDTYDNQYNDIPGSNITGGNFYEYSFDDKADRNDLEEGDAGTTSIYNQTSTAFFRKDQQQHYPNQQQQKYNQQLYAQQQQQQFARQQQGFYKFYITSELLIIYQYIFLLQFNVMF